MSTKPSNKLLAEQSRMAESEVGTYLVDLQEQSDGSWIAYFAEELRRRPELCRELTPELILRIPEWLATCWFDRDKGV
ncbi:hypothetical protein [Pseudomonas parasichuanensis]|jgi:hypothetical protein|uniref:hypothetical protein n=1 Tax=Pseudomonas parasichuanensis TaxID=2892329 RepID=UPI001F3C8E04|nr:hypothetical protein [Pseudomonas parasichuanensis]